jgi:hypothetical protein
MASSFGLIAASFIQSLLSTQLFSIAGSGDFHKTPRRPSRNQNLGIFPAKTQRPQRSENAGENHS